MPNWTENRATFKGPKKEIEKLVSLMGPEFDFNGILPMPESLNVVSGSITDTALVFYVATRDDGDLERLRIDDLEFLRRHVRSFFSGDPVRRELDILRKTLPAKSKEEVEEMFDLGKTYYENLINYGCKTWFEWCSDHWGTKWPASDVSMDIGEDGSVTWEFLTAWCHPAPIYNKIAEEFPKLSYSIAFTNEDDPYNEYVINHTPDEMEEE